MTMVISGTLRIEAKTSFKKYCNNSLFRDIYILELLKEVLIGLKQINIENMDNRKAMNKVELLEQIEITKKHVQQAVDYVDFCERTYDFPEECFEAYHELDVWISRLNDLKRRKLKMELELNRKN